jgi:hypothetical protein
MYHVRFDLAELYLIFSQAGNTRSSSGTWLLSDLTLKERTFKEMNNIQTYVLK